MPARPARAGDERSADEAEPDEAERTAERALQSAFGDERIVDVHVRRLRTKIEANPNAPQLVVTVRGQGYRLDLR